MKQGTLFAYLGQKGPETREDWIQRDTPGKGLMKRQATLQLAFTADPGADEDDPAEVNPAPWHLVLRTLF